MHLVLAITSLGRGGDGKSRSEVYFSPLLEGLIGIPQQLLMLNMCKAMFFLCVLIALAVTKFET